MDKETHQVIDTLAGTLGSFVGGLLDFILAIHIAKSDMKAFWKVIGINLAFTASYRGFRRAEKIFDQAMANDIN